MEFTRMGALDWIDNLPSEFVAECAESFIADVRSADSAGSALDCKVALLAGMQLPGQREFAGVDWHDEYGLLKTAPVFVVKDTPAQVIDAASKHYPLSGNAVVLPVPHALMVFEKPLFKFEPSGVAPHGRDWATPMSAVLWGSAPYDGQDAAVRVVAFAWGAGLGMELTAFSYPPPPGVTLRPEDEALLKWVCAASMFVEQKILVPVEALAERHARKRATTAEIDNRVSVVLLRRVVRSWNVGESSGRDYSCQWLVGGHWRQQWYATKQQHAPRWIAPYVKGPDGKPFKAPSETVFAVTR